jgi:hypothetical protein
MAAGFTGKNQIPLNPPLLKGDFNTPLWKRGAGGIFIAGGWQISAISVWLTPAQARRLCHRLIRIVPVTIILGETFRGMNLMAMFFPFRLFPFSPFRPSPFIQAATAVPI